jgi:hypothetical protein
MNNKKTTLEPKTISAENFSTTPVWYGFGVTFSTSSVGDVLLNYTGTSRLGEPANNSDFNLNYYIIYGTGSAPTNGATNQVGITASFINIQPADRNESNAEPVNLLVMNTIINGLNINETYWFDIKGIVENSTFGGTVSNTLNGDMLFIELSGPKGETGSSGSSGVSGGGGSSVLARAKAPSSSWLISNISVIGSSNLNQSTHTAGTIYLMPYVPGRTFTYTGLSINVAGGVASTNSKILIYDDVDGLPTNKILESTPLSKATTGIKTYTINGTMSSGTMYWMGIVSDTNTAAITTTTTQANVALPFLASNLNNNTYGYTYVSSYASPAVSLTASSIGQQTNNGVNPVIFFQGTN